MTFAIETLTVELGIRSYDIEIGPGLLQDSRQLDALTAGRQVLVVSNETIAPLYVEAAQAGLGKATRTELLTLADGEQYKTLASAERVYDLLMRNNYNRDCCLIALGGGVIGDLTGFVAATYQRGVDFIQIPTTLLSQVDASVGGKTAVNHPLGKNMIGAFHQPRAVLIDTDTLNTLPEREYLAGVAEVIKYGLLGDAPFLDWLEKNLNALTTKQPAVLTEAIRRSCENKARIVAEDETEQSGRRALLNLGHTFAHAIETAQGYGEWLHGEAVATGMCMAADLSRRMGWLSKADQSRCTDLIQRAGLPFAPPAGMTPDEFLMHMAHDKKVAAGQLRLILMRGIGDAIQTADYDPALLDETLQEFCRA